MFGAARVVLVEAVAVAVKAGLPDVEETPDDEDSAELAVEVTEAELPDETEEAEVVALGVLREEMIPLLLTG